MSRTKNAIKNVGFGILGKILTMGFTFASRTVFIIVLGNTYLGVNGLYSEVLAVLSFAELGFGNALTFAMYYPVAHDEHEKIIKLLDFYKIVYRIIAGLIALLGIIIVPFLPYIIKGADWLSIRELRVYFIIFLFNTVVSYFVTYKFSYTNALQKNYITTNFNTILSLVSSGAQIIVLLLTKSFFAYLLVNSGILLISRIFISTYLNNKFPIFKERPQEKLSKFEKKPIYKEVRGLIVHQFGSIAVHSTDNIIISAFTGMGVVAVGLISNYNLITSSVLGFVTILFSSVISGFGNLAATSSNRQFHKVFEYINFANFWIYGFCSVAFFVLIPPFIDLWIGTENRIDSISFALIIINLYLQGQSTTYNNARIAKGNFGKDKWLSLLQAIVNLVISIVGAYYLGLIGVYIGTVVSRLVFVITRPLSTYRFLFGESCVVYYKKLVIYFSAVCLAAISTYFLVDVLLLSNVTVIRFVISVAIVAVLPNIIFLALFFKTKEFKFWKERGTIVLIKLKKLLCRGSK